MRSSKWIVFVAILAVAGVAPAYEGPGMSDIQLLAGRTIPAGHVQVFNTGKRLIDGVDQGSKLYVRVTADEEAGWYLQNVQVQAGFDPIPINRKLNPVPGEFSQVLVTIQPQAMALFYFDLEDDFNFKWGRWYDRVINVAVHADMVRIDKGEIVQREGAWAFAGNNAIDFEGRQWGWWYTYEMGHSMRGQFIDAAVKGLGYDTPTHNGVTGADESGGFQYYPGEIVDFFIGNRDYGFYLGTAEAAKKVSPLDFYETGAVGDPEVIGVARVLQTLDSEPAKGSIRITPEVAACFTGMANSMYFDASLFGDEQAVTDVLEATLAGCRGVPGGDLLVAEPVAPEEAQGNLEAGLNASGIFRKNLSKTEDWGETKQKLEVMPVYFPGLRSDDSPSVCCIDDPYTEEDECDPEGCDDPGTEEVELCGDPGVGYEEWRLFGDPLAEECDPRDYEDPETCQVTLIECRPIAKPLLVTYLEKIDIHDDQVTTDFAENRFAWDTYTAISRDDGTTWKRMNVSRMADMSSFDLETEEPFPGTTGSPYLKVNDNKVLIVWESKFCKSGNPRYSITTCDDPATEEVEWDDPLTEDNECAIYCIGNAEEGTEVCEPDYPGDDDYYVTDIWGVRGQQQSVNYDEVDDVAELGIGEIPYSCLWSARGVIVSQKELDEGTFASLNVEDDPDTIDVDETKTVELGDIIWFKPERITSGRRDVYIPVVSSARGAGFAIAWQEDPDGLRPGKGKGPGEGWSGAISNHKTDIWYTYISYDDFNIVDENFEPGGPGGGTDTEPTGEEGYLDKPGLGRPKALVPFSLPVRITDNDMVNTNTLKVEPSGTCVTPPNGTESVCFPEVVDGSFVPLDPEDIANLFCDGPSPVADCCNHDNHETDPNCEGLEGLHGNLTGTKRYAYLAKTIDEIDNATGLYLAGGDGTLDYQYYMDRGGTLDLCDTTGGNSYMEELPGTSAHERWFGFTNVAGASKLVCVASDGRLIDGDVFASRPMLQLQPYTKTLPDGTQVKSAWALLAYEESKGLGHSLAAGESDHDNVIGGGADDDHDSGQDKPIKQDLGKNLMYHSFDFTQPDLVHPGHIANLPALCGGLYPTWCDDRKTDEALCTAAGEPFECCTGQGTGDCVETNLENPTCTCEPGQPVPLYFDYYVDNGDGTGEWIPDDTKFLQYRTEIARRARFLMQSPGKTGASKTLGALIFKQGQEGQGRPADAFIRRFVKSGTGNPYKFENMECTTYLDEDPIFGSSLPACPNGAGDKPSAVGYNCNVWGEASGDRLCGGTFTDDVGGYLRRDHINLTSANVDLAVGVGPDDDTPDDTTDDVYSRNKVLLWSQFDHNLGDESFGMADGTSCDPLAVDYTPCPGMYSNVRSHRGFIRGDFFVIAYALSPNWAAARNGNDRYNFYTRRSFDGGQTWTTDPDGGDVYVCPEFRTDPNLPDPDPEGSGNLPPQVYIEEAGTCGTYDFDVADGELPPMPVGVAMTNYLGEMTTTPEGVVGQRITAGSFEPARNISEIKSNKETSADPRLGTTPPTYPLDGTSPTLANLCPQGTCVYPEDTYQNNMFFVAWGTADNSKSTGGDSLKTEATPLDLYYTRSVDYGNNFLKIPWEIGGENSNAGYGETVFRYEVVAKGEPEEQGECQLKATADGTKAYVIWHSLIPAEEDPDEIPTRWYPWKPSESSENDLWFRRLIFWPDVDVPVEPIP